MEAVEWCDATKGETFILDQNYPNPVTSSTTIPFSIERPEHVTLTVHDLLGRQIAVLTDEDRHAGKHSVPFDASELRSGMYVTILRTGSAIETRKMLVLHSPVR